MVNRFWSEEKFHVRHSMDKRNQWSDFVNRKKNDIPYFNKRKNLENHDESTSQLTSKCQHEIFNIYLLTLHSMKCSDKTLQIYSKSKENLIKH